MKPHGKSPITSDYDEKVMFFGDVSLGPHETQLRFRLIHFWEAWNPVKKTLIGLKMLLIDEQKYLPKMKPGSVYRLNNFYGSSNKSVYRVSDHAVTVSLSWNSELSVLEDSPTPFDEDRFRFHSFEDFQANCDRKGDLYGNLCYPPHHLFVAVLDVSIIETPVLDEVEIARARHVLVHVQSHDDDILQWTCDEALPLGPGCKRLLKKFKSYENTPTVLLVTTVNTKSLGGTLALTSMSSSRVFMDYDVQPTINYFDWLSSNPQSVERVDAEVVTKRETLGEIFSYIKQGASKCTATIDDVVHGSAWYRAQISVYDNSEQAVFVLLGDAGYELTGKHASELVSNYFEANGNQGVTQEVHVPEALISTIGQKHNFCVKVTKHNLEGKSRSLTVSKILPMETPAATESSEETFETGANVCEASKVSVDSAEGMKRTCGIDEMGNAKRFKGGN
ncbi:hypothetical protein Bca101_038987 [Brassica carinata]